LACAAALATLDTYEEEDLFNAAITHAPYWEEAIHALHGLPNVIDIRNYGLIGAVELAPRPDSPGSRGYDVFNRAFHEQNLMVRCTGDVIALSPPLILNREHIDRIFDRLAATIRATA
jgi:beta-alanine--pyruvate transaminase